MKCHCNQNNDTTCDNSPIPDNIKETKYYTYSQGLPYLLRQYVMAQETKQSEKCQRWIFCFYAEVMYTIEQESNHNKIVDGIT